MEGVLSSSQVVLVTVLIVLCMCFVWIENGSVRKHEKNLGMYLNLKLFGLDNNGLYEDGDNQDENYVYFVDFEEMKNVVRSMFNVTGIYA